MDTKRRTTLCHTLYNYYGFSHLLINLNYIAEGVVMNNQVVYISCEPWSYQQFIKRSTAQDIEKNVKFLSLEQSLSIYEGYGIEGQREYFKNLAIEAFRAGYKGVLLIQDVSYTIEMISKKLFLEWEEDLNQILTNSFCALLCLYDYNDFMNKKNYIDEEIVGESYETHTHMFYKFRVEKNE